MSHPLPAKAVIYRPAKTAMQSGVRKTRDWLLEFVPIAGRYSDDLMGWTGSRDTTQQVRLRFPSLEAARAYAEQHGITYEVKQPQERMVHPKSYADNFTFHKVNAFTGNPKRK